MLIYYYFHFKGIWLTILEIPETIFTSHNLIIVLLKNSYSIVNLELIYDPVLLEE